MTMVRQARYGNFRKVLSGCCLLMGMLSACSVSRKVHNQAVDLLLADSLVQQAHTGICLYEPATGRYWLRHQDDHYFLPGSNVKLFTLYAALQYLGDSLPGLRYRTAANGTVEVLPTGDPTLLSARFPIQPVPAFLQRQRRVMIRWPDAPLPFGKGWAWDDVSYGFMPARSALPLYENKMLVRRDAGGQLSVMPGLLNNNLPLTGQQSERWPGNLFPAVGLPADAGTALVPFANDAATATRLLRDTLGAVSIADPDSTDEQPWPNRKFTVIRTQPLDSVLRYMMLHSDNFYAEQLLLMSANEYLGRMDEAALIDTLLKTELRGLHDKPVWVDGSGLSRYNLCTPRSLVALLDTLRNVWGLERIQRLLPTGGEGTLKNYFNNDSGYIFAKTGTLSNQWALSGYLLTRQNRLLLFSVLINNAPGRVAILRKATERFLSAIRDQF